MFKTLMVIFSVIFISLFLISCGDTVTPGPPDPDDGYPEFIEILPASDSVRVDSGSVKFEDTSFTYLLLDTLISHYEVYDTTVVDSSDSTSDSLIIDTTVVERLDIYETELIVDSISGKFNFWWKAIPNADVYYIWVSDSATGEVLYFKSDSATTYTVRGLEPDNVYYVSVSGYDSKKKIKSLQSEAVTVRLRYPAPPPYIKADVFGSTIKITWLKNSTDIGVVGYKVYLYNSTGHALDSSEITSTDNLSALFSADINSVYKAAVITKTSIGYGTLDSIYAYDQSNLSDSKLRFPSIFISTYEKPISLDGDMVGVAGGGFIMGKIWSDTTEKDSYISGLPRHEVELTSFFIGKSEVTCSDFANFLNSLDSISVLKDTLNQFTYRLNSNILLEKSKNIIQDSVTKRIMVRDSSKLNTAVAGIYFAGAAKYCNYLSTLRGYELAYDDALKLDTTKSGYRLPTEAEFEYLQSAAFLGTKERFPWGYHDDTKLYVSSGSEAQTAYFGEAYFGIFNLTGNVEEICSDATDRNSSLYPNSFYSYCDSLGVVKNPINLSTGEKILRGGGFNTSKGGFVSNRRVVDITTDYSAHGFRVTRWDR